MVMRLQLHDMTSGNPLERESSTEQKGWERARERWVGSPERVKTSWLCLGLGVKSPPSVGHFSFLGI